MTEFVATIVDIDDGRLNEQLTQELARVVRAATETRKKGSIVLELTVTPDNERVTVAAKVTTKLPQASTMPTTFFTTEEGDLSRDDPRQMQLKHVVESLPIRG